MTAMGAKNEAAKVLKRLGGSETSVTTKREGNKRARSGGLHGGDRAFVKQQSERCTSGFHDTGKGPQPLGRKECRALEM